MKNVLFWGDNPHGITGFGKVVKNVIRQIYNEEKFKIDVLGISYLGDPYTQDEYLGNKLNYDVYSPFEPGRNLDLYATGKVRTFLSTGKVDILFILQDTFIVKNVMKDIIEIRNKLKNKFVIIYYYPIDSHHVYEDWITDSVSLVDFPVCYTEFGKSMSVKHDRRLKNMDVIYHGTDKSLYKSWDSNSKFTMRKSFWGEDVARKFIILNVNRNQPRKDINRTFAVFKEVKKYIPEAFLFVLANPADIGGNIIEVAKQHGLVFGKDWMSPDPGKYNPMLGIPEQQVVTMYNLSDVCISTSLGEGWGLSLTEAMACGCPVVFPDNSSITEIIGKDYDHSTGIRGTLIESGKDGNTICLGPGDNNLVRPLVNIIDMANEIVKIGKNLNNTSSGFKLKANDAMDWVPSWEDVGVHWRRVFEEASVTQDEMNGVKNEG